MKFVPAVSVPLIVNLLYVEVDFVIAGENVWAFEPEFATWSSRISPPVISAMLIELTATLPEFVVPQVKVWAPLIESPTSREDIPEIANEENEGA